MVERKTLYIVGFLVVGAVLLGLSMQDKRFEPGETITMKFPGGYDSSCIQNELPSELEYEEIDDETIEVTNKLDSGQTFSTDRIKEGLSKCQN